MTLKARITIFLSGCLLAVMTLGVSAEEKPNEDREGGIIGTGIVGTITELGSIIVNGQRITYGDDDMARSALGERLASTLTPGDTVVVVARPSSQDWVAEQIDQHHPAIGPITLQNGALTLLGASLDLSQAQIETQRLAPTLSDGDWVAVSGLWKGPVLMVTKLDRIDPRENAVLSGSYMPRSDNAFMIGGSIVGGLDLEHVDAGDSVTVTGAPSPNGIQASEVRIGLFSEPMYRIIAQGYMSAPTPTGLYTILGSGMVSFTDQPEMIDTQSAGVFCLSMEGNEDLATVTSDSLGACR